MTIAPTYYIAGPMTGIEDYNYPAFNAAAEKLRAQGANVLNPAELGGPAEHPDWDWTDYMRAALALLLQADGIVLLDGWDTSRGARIEYNLAVNLQMPVHLIQGMNL